MLVEVSFLGNIAPPDTKPEWRTCVWGNDDTGYEFDCSTEEECWNKFLEVLKLEFVNVDRLKAIGFIRA